MPLGPSGIDFGSLGASIWEDVVPARPAHCVSESLICNPNVVLDTDCPIPDSLAQTICVIAIVRILGCHLDSFRVLGTEAWGKWMNQKSGMQLGLMLRFHDWFSTSSSHVRPLLRLFRFVSFRSNSFRLVLFRFARLLSKKA